MKRQWNTFQTKEQDKSSEKELNRMEISNLPSKEFKEIVIKMTAIRRKWMKLTENFNKEIKNIKKNQSELKTTITERKTH